MPDGKMKRIPQLHFWSLLNVIIEKYWEGEGRVDYVGRYRFRHDEAVPLCAFMLPDLH